jgi:hypothetical protein
MSIASQSGACLCGAVRFTAKLPSSFCGHCHCSMCRRNHGAGFVTWFAVPKEQLVIDDGENELVEFASSDHGTRSFCGRCGSSLFCVTGATPDHIDIPLASMDGPIDRAPKLHIFFDDRVEWVDVNDGLPRLGGETGLEPITE